MAPRWNRSARSRSAVVEYLFVAYTATQEAIETAVATDPEIERDMSIGSHVSYIGDRIATAHGWPEKEGFDVDEDDGIEPDEDEEEPEE